MKEVFQPVRARTTDPETSQQAAFDFEQDQQKVARSVSTVVRILSDRPDSTDFEIREAWSRYWEGSWSFTLPSKARHWAREQGLVRHSGFGSHNGRRVRTWALGYELVSEPERCECCGQVIRRKTS